MTRFISSRTNAWRIAILMMAAGLTGCQPQANVAPSNQPAVNTAASNIAPAANTQWDDYVNHFLNDYFVARPDFAVVSGKHEFDGKLPDWSEDGLRREIARLHAERDKATAFKAE